MIWEIQSADWEAMGQRESRAIQLEMELDDNDICVFIKFLKLCVFSPIS